METIFNDELQQFANWFSQNYQITAAGTFQSANKNYELRYEPFFADGMGRFLSSPCRIDNNSGVVQFQRQSVIQDGFGMNNPDFIFFLVLWIFALKNSGDISLSDHQTFDFYMNTGRSTDPVMLGWAAVFRRVNIPDNITRFNQMKSFINQRQPNGGNIPIQAPVVEMQQESPDPTKGPSPEEIQAAQAILSGNASVSINPDQSTNE